MNLLLYLFVLIVNTFCGSFSFWTNYYYYQLIQSRKKQKCASFVLFVCKVKVKVPVAEWLCMLQFVDPTHKAVAHIFTAGHCVAGN